MFITALLIGLIGALSQWESRMMGEIKLSQPIVTGLLVGIVLGDVKTGVIMGAQFQLLWMGISGVGATPMMDVGVGSILGTSFAILTGVGMEVALTLALPVALLSQHLNIGVRTLINGFMPKADGLCSKRRHERHGPYSLVWRFLVFPAGLYSLFLRDIVWLRSS